LRDASTAFPSSLFHATAIGEWPFPKIGQTEKTKINRAILTIYEFVVIKIIRTFVAIKNLCRNGVYSI